jgi:acyl CoA:acetate/3-ketoacid CoA transferase beta subunit
VLDIETQEQYLAKVGADRLDALRAKSDGESWRTDEAMYVPDLDAPPNAWEQAAAMAARHLAARAIELDADAVLAGAGVANLAAWLGVLRAREAGAHTTLTAEIGMWDYVPVPADPFVLNHRNFPTTSMLSDATTVLGTLVGGYGSTTIGCLGGAQIDRFGNINSTSLLADGGPFLVGSGGGNDVASTATECIVVALLTPQRTPPDCSYITSPGRVVRALVTDLGTFEKGDGDASGELVLTAVPAGTDTIDERVARARAATGWDVRVAPEVRVLPAVEPDDVACLRRWDPRGWFLRG